MRHDLFPAGKGHFAGFFLYIKRPQPQTESRMTCITALQRLEQNKRKSLMLLGCLASESPIQTQHNEMQKRRLRSFPLTSESYSKTFEMASKKLPFLPLRQPSAAVIMIPLFCAIGLPSSNRMQNNQHNSAYAPGVRC